MKLHYLLVSLNFSYLIKITINLCNISQIFLLLFSELYKEPTGRNFALS